MQAKKKYCHLRGRCKIKRGILNYVNCQQDKGQIGNVA